MFTKINVQLSFLKCKDVTQMHIRRQNELAETVYGILLAK
jgi:hypothetical protein